MNQIEKNINILFYDNKMTDIKKQTFDNVYVAELAIRKLIQNDNNCSAHFEYEYDGHARGELFYRLDLITLNPNHNTHFLLHSIYGDDDKLALMTNMYDYVYKLKNSMKKKDNGNLNYTVEWYDGKKSVKSYFCAESIEDVIRKFNYGKTVTPTISSIILSPTS